MTQPWPGCGRRTAAPVAATLGHALMAPVVAYVPEGRIDPPTEHMRFAGTVSIPEPVFQAVLEAATRWFWQPAFRDVVLICDHCGCQGAPRSLAARLQPSAAQPGARVDFAGVYYQSRQAPFSDLLCARPDVLAATGAVLARPHRQTASSAGFGVRCRRPAAS